MNPPSGKELKQRRQQLGLSLEQVSSDLKIHVRILQGLEDENPELKLVDTIRRGFLRSYARYLRFEPPKLSEGVVDENSRSVGKQDQNLKVEEPKSLRTKADSFRSVVIDRESSVHGAWWWLAGFVGLVLIGRGVYEWTQPRGGSEPSLSFSSEGQETPPNLEGPRSDAINSSFVSQTLVLPPQMSSAPFPPQTPVKGRWVVLESRRAGQLSFDTPEGQKTLTLEPNQFYLFWWLLPSSLLSSRPEDLKAAEDWTLIDQGRALKLEEGNLRWE